MFWFVCLVLKYILPVRDGPKEDLQESTLYFSFYKQTNPKTYRKTRGKYKFFFKALQKLGGNR